MPDAATTRRVLVTGGAGFIGSHLVRLLLQRGYEVRVLDLDDSPALDRRAELVRGSVLDRARVREAVRGASWVFHLAADPNLWASDRRHSFATNHAGARMVIEEAADAGAERVVHTSTESVLVRRSRGDTATLDETVSRSIDEMCGAYCRSKLLGEREAADAARRGLPVIIVNPTMPIGPGDHRITPPTRMLLDFLNGRNPAYLEFEMNLVDVADAALGHLLAAERGRIGQRYILGGTNLRLSEILRLLRDLTGLPMPSARMPYLGALAFAAMSEFLATHVTRRPPRASLTGVRLAGAGMRVDSSKAVRDLGLVQTPVRESLAKAVAWLAQENKLRRPLPRGALGLQDA